MCEHNEESDDDFEVIPEVDGDRILLIDDMFTAGASLQSAASAREIAGADVVAAICVGRYIGPDWGPGADLLELARRMGSRWTNAASSKQPMSHIGATLKASVTFARRPRGGPSLHVAEAKGNGIRTLLSQFGAFR